MEKNIAQNQENILKRAFSFSFAQMGDVTAYQTFTFLIFTFYYTIARLHINLVTIGFIIWSIWNSVNDPMLGHFSDHTHSKFGRRLPWIITAFIPLSVIMILLFTPPLNSGETMIFIYFLIIICVFELFYTMYSLNITSMFPEVFLNPIERFRANNIRQIASIIGLILAFVVPTFIITDMTAQSSRFQYIIVGIVSCCLIIGFSLLFFKYAPKERKEFQADYKNTPPFIQSFKITLKNKAFTRYIPAEIASWFVFGLLPTIVPLYGKYILHINEGSILLGLLLAVAFISAAIFMSLWARLVKRFGTKKSWIISQFVWIITLIPFMFIDNVPAAFICFFLLGIGMAGTLYHIDLVVSDIIDYDEVETGVRREASYYGINAFFLRMSTILVFISINSVFNSVGWAVFDPEKMTTQIELGLRSLMSIFPAIALVIGIIALSRYPLDGKNLEEMKIKLAKIHKEKNEQVK